MFSWGSPEGKGVYVLGEFQELHILPFIRCYSPGWSLERHIATSSSSKCFVFIPLSM